MLWLKAFHIVFVITWFAGLFYLPRLFVYHAAAGDAPSLERFQLMERRLFAIMSLGALLAILFGLAMLLGLPAYLQQTWLQIKLVLVGLLCVYHLWCYFLLRSFQAGRNTRSPRWYRWFNELPTLLLLAIVVLATVKP